MHNYHAKSPFPSECNQLGNEGLTFLPLVADFFSTYYVSSDLSWDIKDESNLLKSLLLLIASSA